MTLSWAALKGQFGQEYADTKNFKRKFLGALKKATGAYKEARIETVPGGLKLLPSPPPVKRSIVAVPRSAAPDAKERKALMGPPARRLRRKSWCRCPRWRWCPQSRLAGTNISSRRNTRPGENAQRAAAPSRARLPRVGEEVNEREITLGLTASRLSSLSPRFGRCLAAGASRQSLCDANDEPASQCGNRGGHVALRPEGEIPARANPRVGQAAGGARRDVAPRGEWSPSRRPGSRRRRCSV